MMYMIILPISNLMLQKSWSALPVCLPSLMVIASTKLFSPLATPLTVSHFVTLDSMSVLLIMLSLWIANLMFITSLKIEYLKKDSEMFLGLVLTLISLLIMAFSVNSMWLFYILFEASLIPTFIIVLKWGAQPERISAGMYLMIYTVSASLPMFMAFNSMSWNTNQDNMFFVDAYEMILQYAMCPQYWSFMGLPLLLGFLVKMPMYSTHLWLPKAHVEAPVAGSMILASVLLKLGGYGLLRMINMFPFVTESMKHFVIPISITGAMLTSIMCMRQTDMKSMIAYSSVSHMAFVITGIFTMNKWGWEGSLIMMMSHGLVSSGLFAAANMYYENSQSRSLLINTGLMLICPSMALMWFLLIAANMAAPPFINLLSEMILIVSAAAYASPAPIFMIIASFFTVCYSMILYTSLHHGATNPSIRLFRIIPMYYTVLSMHILPTTLLIFAAQHLVSWT